MPKRIEVGTDIATIGVWDPAHERHDLEGAKYADYDAALRSEAQSGRLFYMNTGADGGCPVDIFVDETPDADVLTAYSQVPREFLVISESGRLIAGGVEDFVSAQKQITSPDDEISVPPGRYRLTLHQLDDDKYAENLRAAVGADDVDYYETRWSGIPWGCLLFVVGAVILLLRLWFVAIGVFALWAVYMFVRSRMRASDARYQEIATRIGEHEERFPELILTLRQLDDSTDLKGGWHDLN